jgi:hypothetical protein
MRHCRFCREGEKGEKGEKNKYEMNKYKYILSWTNIKTTNNKQT